MKTPRTPQFSFDSNHELLSDLEGEQEGAEEEEELDVYEVDESEITHLWNRFNTCHTVWFICRNALPTTLVSVVWSIACVHFQAMYPEQASTFHSDFTLKALTFLVGMLTSMTLTESLDRYRKCYAALIGFREELRALWYYLQLQVIHCPALKLLLDLHLIWYNMSLARYLYEMTGEAYAHDDVERLVPLEFRDMALFADYGAPDGYPKELGADPNVAELVLVSWFGASGVLDSEVLRRWRVVRHKVNTLISAERVKTPQTSRHLQLLTLQLFFTLIPVCADSLVTKLMAPVIALILMSLLKLSQEVEDPFGFDTHDLPWIQVLGTLTRCSLRDVDEQTKENVVLWFNHGARTGEFGPIRQSLISKEYVDRIQLDLYLTQPLLQTLHTIGAKNRRG
jgi:hypothetical protein